MFLLKLFKKEINNEKNPRKKTNHVNLNQTAIRKGELGEYKNDIQLSQLPKEFRVLHDVLLKNPKARSGFSQIDHVIICPYAIFVIETKNYQGTIYGSPNQKDWTINGKFKMMNPFIQNYGHIQAIKNFIEPKFHEFFISIISFTKRSTFKTDLSYRKIQSNELIIYDLELTDFINRKISILKLQNSQPFFSEVDIDKCFSELSKANITNPTERAKHIHSLKKHSLNKQCVLCSKTVSEKEIQYCKNNKKFNGNIYCFEHQKNIRN